jgi:hypothetical protein
VQLAWLVPLVPVLFVVVAERLAALPVLAEVVRLASLALMAPAVPRMDRHCLLVKSRAQLDAPLRTAQVESRIQMPLNMVLEEKRAFVITGQQLVQERPGLRVPG